MIEPRLLEDFDGNIEWHALDDASREGRVLRVQPLDDVRYVLRGKLSGDGDRSFVIPVEVVYAERALRTRIAGPQDVPIRHTQGEQAEQRHQDQDGCPGASIDQAGPDIV